MVRTTEYNKHSTFCGLKSSKISENLKICLGQGYIQLTYFLTTLGLLAALVMRVCTEGTIPKETSYRPVHMVLTVLAE